MNEKTVVMCDLGNVLIGWDPEALYSKFIPNAVERRGFLKKIGFMPWNLEQDKGRSWSEGEALLIAKFPEHEHLIRAYRKNYLDTIGSVNNDVVALLKEAKNRGIRLYAASNWNDETFELARPRMTFLNLFDGLYVSGFVGIVKPDPTFFSSMMVHFGFAAQEAIFIDDNEANIESAQRLGIASIHFLNAEQLKQDLEQGNNSVRPTIPHVL